MWNESLASNLVSACIRIVSWWMLPLSWSVFLSGQQIDPPLYRSASSLSSVRPPLPSNPSILHHPSPVLTFPSFFFGILFLLFPDFLLCLSFPRSLHHLSLVVPSCLHFIFLSPPLCLGPPSFSQCSPKVRELMMLQEKLHLQHGGNQ